MKHASWMCLIGGVSLVMAAAEESRSALPPMVDLVTIDVSTPQAREAGTAQLQQIEANLQLLRARMHVLDAQTEPINQALADLVEARAYAELQREPYKPPSLMSFAQYPTVAHEGLKHLDMDPLQPLAPWKKTLGQLRARERELHQQRSTLASSERDLTLLRARLMAQLGIGGEPAP